MIKPPVITGKSSPFAFKTVNERWPKIITGIVDKLHRFHNKAVEKSGPKAGEDVKFVISKLSEMRYLMMTDKQIEPMDNSAEDAAIWNKEMDSLNKNGTVITWYGPWLFVECYMYRIVQEYFRHTKFIREYDPFWEDKTRSYSDGYKHMLAIGTELVKLMDKQLDPVQTREAILRLLQISLWGNKCDLSLSGGDPHSMSATIFHELDEFRHNILVDDLDRFVDQYAVVPQKQLDIILDNSGLELFMDLCLGDFLIYKGLVKKINLHGKQFPWFVSDATKRDLEWLIQKLVDDADPITNKLGNRWRKHLNQGIFEFHAHPFWTQCFDYSRMYEKAPDLYAHLRSSSLLIFKGDLNYRKLVGDRQWPLQTPFSQALCGFEPAPLLALRTLKAETAAGLSAEALRKISDKFKPDDLTWMVSSDYAVAQLYEPTK